MAGIIDAGQSLKGAALSSSDTIESVWMDFLPGRVFSKCVRKCCKRKKAERRRHHIISRREMDQRVRAMFKGIFKGDYLYHYQAQDTHALDELVLRRRALAQKLIRCHLQYAAPTLCTQLSAYKPI